MLPHQRRYVEHVVDTIDELVERDVPDVARDELKAILSVAPRWRQADAPHVSIRYAGLTSIEKNGNIDEPPYMSRSSTRTFMLVKERRRKHTVLPMYPAPPTTSTRGTSPPLNDISFFYERIAERI